MMMRCVHFSGFVFALLLLTTPTSQAAIIIDDPGFDSSFSSDFNVQQNDADNGWRAPGSGNWAQDNSVNGRTAANRTGQFTDSLLQVIEDNQMHTGLYTLQFDAINTETWANPSNIAGFNQLSVGVYGISQNFTFTTGSNAIDSNATFLGGNEVLDGLSANSFGWTTFTASVDLGTGYQYLIFRITGLLNSGSATETAGELLAVDDISLTAIPEPATMSLLAIGTVLAAHRRKRHMRT